MQNNYFLPELLSPAGNQEKMKVAFDYGADAVYLAGTQFGLRSAADNFTLNEIEQSIQWARKRNKKIYITLNAFLHTKEQEALPTFLQELERLRPHAVLVSDIAVLEIVRKHTSLNIHVSTQASVMNRFTAKLWQELGAKRIVVARETSIANAAKIGRHLGIEIEMFVHGAMCMSYSGYCSISNYTAGRDSNRGGCIQSCRFLYFNTNKSEDSQSILSSKDLQSLEYLDQLVKEGIQSLKIEGRMKSSLYVATVTRAYRQALSLIAKNKTDFSYSYTELKKLPHRGYTTAFLGEQLADNSVYNETSEKAIEHTMVGNIIEIDQARERFFLHNKTKLTQDMNIVVLGFDGNNYNVSCQYMESVDGKPLLTAQSNRIISLPFVQGIQSKMLVRKE